MNTQDPISPHRIIENARQYIRENLHGDLKPRLIAKEIGVQVKDLHASYECATLTTLELDTIKIRLHAFYEDIKHYPDVNNLLQAQRCGLEYGEELEQEFESEFWISIQDHRLSSKQNLWAGNYK